MYKFTINLLPKEFQIAERVERKKVIVVRLSVGLILLMIITTGILLFFVVNQNTKVSQATVTLSASKNGLAAYKEQEAIATILKSRIDGVNSLNMKDYPQPLIYKLIVSLIPTDVSVLNFSANASGQVSLQGQSLDAAALQSFFDNLIDPKKNEAKISTVSVESLGKGANGAIGFDLTIQTTGISTK